VAQWKDFVGGPIWWRNKSKMADGRHLGFRFLAIISASINIFAPNLVQWWKIGSPRGPSAQKSDFLNYWSQRLRVFSARSIAGSNIQWMMNDPKRGRGEGHVTYFWAMGQIPAFHRTYFVFSYLFSCYTEAAYKNTYKYKMQNALKIH